MHQTGSSTFLQGSMGECKGQAIAEAREASAGLFSRAKQSTKSAYLPSKEAPTGEAATSRLVQAQSGDASAPLVSESGGVNASSQLQRSKAMAQSPLLTLPPETELHAGWTVGNEVQLAAAGQEFLDRWGKLSM